MKYFSLQALILIALVFAAFSVSALDKYVTDNANALSPQDKASIEQVLKSIKDSGSAEFAVVIVPNLGGKDINTYSLELVQENLGDSEKNTGLLLLVAMEEHEYRFEVGRGLEGIFNDAKAGRIGREILVPNFQAGNYGLGIYQASVAVNEVLAGNEIPVKRTGFPTWAIVLIMVGIFAVIIAISFLAKGDGTSGNYGTNNRYRPRNGFNRGFSRSGGPRFGSGGFGGGGAGGKW